MKRDKLFIYIGTVVFFLLAIALGIIMFMMTKTASKLENEQSQVGQSGEEISERVSTEIGKGVNEQTSNNDNTNTDVSEASDKTEETSQNTNASVSNETSGANGVKEEKPVTEVKVEQQYQKNLGKSVEIKLNDHTKLNGILLRFTPEEIVIEQEEKKIIEGSKRKQLVKTERTIVRNDIKEIKDIVKF